MLPRRVFSVLMVLILFSLHSSCTMITKMIAEEPKVSLQNVEISSISWNAIKTILVAEVENPNKFDLGLKNLVFDVSVDGVDVGDGSYGEAFSVPAGEKGTIKIPFNIDSKSALKIAQKFLSGGQNLTARVKGKMVFTTKIGDYEIDFDETKPLVNKKM
ncbi:MAG: LEA type 2 family protein [Pseudobacteriovorax sp.]|nr:LEA type 2 family protein [Pseudobacteriovorax sp.]